jgi:hypothetical protein
MPMPGNEVNRIMYEMGTAQTVASTARAYGFSWAMRAHYVSQRK